MLNCTINLGIIFKFVEKSLIKNTRTMAVVGCQSQLSHTPVKTAYDQKMVCKVKNLFAKNQTLF